MNQQHKKQPPPLTADQLDEFHDAFELFDKDGDGTIDADELGDLMKTLGQNPTKYQLKEMVEEADTNGNGAIDFDEFITMMQTTLHMSAEERQILQKFAVFDKDGDGQVSLGELKMVMKSMGQNLKDDELRALMREIDEDGDEQVNYREFMKFLRS